MKISIIMPTYNDSESIVETLDSIRVQSYENWELVVMDDGSTDNTKEIISSYKKEYNLDEKIKYYYQQNQDQLNAIINGSKYINGRYVYILHSDDLLPNEEFLYNLIETARSNLDIDVFIGNLTIINESSEIVGEQKVSTYSKKKKILPTLMLWLGRNLYVDVIFAKKEVFNESISESYLKWNMPFWIDIDNNLSTLNVRNLDFPILKYRVHNNNYINNELGKLNVINGELRTVTRLMEFYDIPFYRLQFYIYRIFNKIKLSKIYAPIYLNREQKNKHQVVEFIIKKRFGNKYYKNQYLNSLVKFYENTTQRKIWISSIEDDEIIYKGKDMRLFNKKLLNNQLSDLYQMILNEMEKGFDEIVVSRQSDIEKIRDITKFLCIYPYIKISKTDK